MAKSAKRSTIKDVAAAADVSISTVSLVMNGKKHVADATRERVLEVARQLGYAPQQAARQLASQKTGNIGFVVRDDHFRRSEPFYTRIFLGTEFEARHQGVYVLLTTVPSEYEPGAHSPRFLREQNVDGLIIAGKVPRAFIDEVDEYALPVVLVDFETARHPSVTIDNQGGAREAVEHLIAGGHERVAFVAADLEHPSITARREGYQLAVAASGIPVDPALVVVAEAREPRRSTGQELGHRLLGLEPRPTAAFCVNDAVALGVLDAARQRDVGVPADLAVIGFDDVESAAHAVTPLTTMRVPKEQLGELALRYLSELIDETPGLRDQYRRRAHRVKVPAELIVRASTQARERE